MSVHLLLPERRRLLGSSFSSSPHYLAIFRRLRPSARLKRALGSVKLPHSIPTNLLSTAETTQRQESCRVRTLGLIFSIKMYCPYLQFWPSLGIWRDMNLGRAESGNQRACVQSEAAEQGVAAKMRKGKRRRELRR